MAKDERLEVQWVTFSTDVRVSSSSGHVKAMVRNEKTRLFFGLICGQPFLIVEDVSLPHPATIPWHSVVSLGWVTQPPVDGATPKERVLK